MSKYQPLAEHLAGRAGQFWRATFDELEDVLGFPLPKTAHTSNAWWENSAEKPHQNAWRGAGWRVESVDRPGKAVLFHREGYEPADEVPERYFNPASPPAPPRPPGQISKMVGVTAAVGGVVALTAALGALTLRAFRRK